VKEKRIQTGAVTMNKKTMWMMLGLVILSVMVVGKCRSRVQDREAREGLPPDIKAIYFECQDCHAKPKLTPEEISGFYTKKQVQASPDGSMRFPCPACGKNAVVQVVEFKTGEKVAR
jgi:hypothetical protein